MIRLIIYLCVLAGVIAGGLKAYLWYEVHKHMETLIRATAPFAEVSYASVHSTFSGEIGVTGVEIRPLQAGDTLRIGSIIFEAPNLLFLFNGKQQIESGVFPNSLGFQINQVGISLNGEFGRSLDQYAKQDKSSANWLPCGDVTHFGVYELRSMGYDALVVDLAGSMRLDDITGDYYLDMRVGVSDNGRADIQFQYDVKGRSISWMQFATAEPKVEKIRLRWEDTGWNRRANAFCAAQTGKTMPEYTELVIEKTNENLAKLGVKVGPSVLNAYREFLSGENTFVAELQPSQSVNFEDLKFYAVADIPKLLGVSLWLNEQPITDLGIELTPAFKQNLESKRSIDKLLESKPKSTEPSRPKAKKLPPREWVETNLSEISQHMGREARVHLVTGQVRVGRIKSVLAEDIEVLERIHGGSFGIKIPRKDIASIEIFRR